MITKTSVESNRWRNDSTSETSDDGAGSGLGRFSIRTYLLPVRAGALELVLGLTLKDSRMGSMLGFFLLYSKASAVRAFTTARLFCTIATCICHIRSSRDAWMCK